jgi:hypothetical protein
VSELSSQIGEWTSGPIYDRSRPLVQRLEYLAFHLPMIRRFKALALAETPEGVLPEAAKPSWAGQKVSAQEVWQVYLADEVRLTKRREYIATQPELADDVGLLVDWIVYGNKLARENFFQALSVYEHAILAWSAHELAAIHTLWACRQLWEAGCDQLTALTIREKTIALWEQTEQLIGQDPQDKLYGIDWGRLFDELGIPLKFPRGGYHNKK